MGQDNGKSFTVYNIHVASTSGRYFTLAKRYHCRYLVLGTKSLQKVLQPPRAVPQVQGEVPCASSVPAQEIGQHILQGGK